jgi:septin family protein
VVAVGVEVNVDDDNENDSNLLKTVLFSSRLYLLKARVQTAVVAVKNVRFPRAQRRERTFTTIAAVHRGGERKKKYDVYFI